MRGRGMDRWARGEGRGPGPSPLTPPQAPHPPELSLMGLELQAIQMAEPRDLWAAGGRTTLGKGAQRLSPRMPRRFDLLNSDPWPWPVSWLVAIGVWGRLCGAEMLGFLWVG